MQEKEARREEKLRFTCKCSFLEIYNEQILDLLDPSTNNLQVWINFLKVSTNQLCLQKTHILMFMLQIREDTKKGVYVENLKEVEVTSARDVIQQLIQVYEPFIICSFIFFL
jgi:kinesin family protein 15